MQNTYLDAVEHLRAMTADLPGVDAARLREADALIAQSRAQLDAAYSVLASAYEAVPDKDDETTDDFIGQFQYLNHFDDIAAENREKLAGERQKRSDLDPSGGTRTNTALHECAGRIVAAVRNHFGDAPVNADVWSQRWYNGEEIISCDFWKDETDRPLPLTVTITALGQQRLDITDEPDVFDMTEALHLAGLITQALNATVTVGRTDKEANEAVLSAPLPAGHTTGRINLWQDR